MDGLSGKKLLVTGAGQGIGAAIAARGVDYGARVYAVDMNSDALKALKFSGDEWASFVVDVTDRAAINRLYDEIGDVDILCNVAGYVHNGSILDCRMEDWQKSIDINLTSMYSMINRFLPGMIEEEAGNIINVASVVSTIKAVPNRFAYSVSKAGVIALTKSIAVDFIKSGIRCNAICPGTIDSPSLRSRLEATGDFDSAYREFVNRQPMGRLGTVEEVADLAMYLASDKSGFVTGAAMICDGGMSL